MCVMWTSQPRSSSRLSIAPWAARSAELQIQSIAEPADPFGYGGGLTAEILLIIETDPHPSHLLIVLRTV